jgi:hypothetical protein
MVARQVPVHLAREKQLLKNIFTISFVIMIALLKLNAQTTFESNWTDILGDYVTMGQKGGVELAMVNYAEIANDDRFEKLVAGLGSFNPESLFSKNKKLAFWINAYNIAAIKIVIDNWPVKSIRDIGGVFSPVWKKDAITIGGKKYSLNFIEHNILRKMNEPRIHFAIVCASVSCPDILNEAYTANDLENQLDNQTGSFLQNRQKGLRFENDNKLYISSIFKWFKKDFGDKSGINKFITKHINKDVNHNSLKYMTYNWDLNMSEEISIK